MSKITIDPLALASLKHFKMPTKDGFCPFPCPVMIETTFQNGQWEELKLLPYGPIQLDPFSKVFHYGQEIFEGMKAYHVDSQYPLIFRPEDNFMRFNRSAQRLAMPQIPKEIFMQAVESMVSYSAPFMPRQSGQFLYIRPFMFASEAQLGVRPSNKFRFMVVAGPTRSYFSGKVNVMIERKGTRAAPGGTGNVKAGGNYAAAAPFGEKALSLGYQQVLWLDAFHKKYIEELSAMNFFAIKKGALYTPSLTDTILPGITRDSIIQLAQVLKIEVRQEKMDIADWISAIKAKKCTEAFACGTAVTVSPLASLGEEDGERYEFAEENGPITQKIRQALLDIQEGRVPSPWVKAIPPAICHDEKTLDYQPTP